MKQSLQDEQKQQQSSGEDKNQKSEPDGHSDGQRGGDSFDRAIAEMDSAIRNLVKELGEQGLSDNEISETVKQDNGKVGLVCEGRLERGCQHRPLL